MIVVTVTLGNLAATAGTAFQLVSTDGKVLSSAKADAAGVVTFDVDSSAIGPVGIRLDHEAMPAPAG